MEHRSNDLFVLEFDHQASAHILQSAKWSRFLAVVWFVMCALMAFGAVITVATEDKVSADKELGLFCFLAWVAIQLVANIFRFRFAKRAINAINNTDQEMLIASLNQLRIYNKYWGIVFIIGIALFLLMFALGMFSVITGL